MTLIDCAHDTWNEIDSLEFEACSKPLMDITSNVSSCPQQQAELAAL